MAPGALVCAVLLFGALPPESDEDVSLIDKPELSKIEKDAAVFEARAMPKAPSTPELKLERGGTLFVELDVPLASATKGLALEGRAGDVRAARDLRIIPWLEIEERRAKEKVERTEREASGGGRSSVPRPSPAVRVAYVVRALPAAALGISKATATLELFEKGSDVAVATVSIAHTIEIIESAATLESIDLDRRTYLYHQSIAIDAYKSLASLHDYLRLDRVDPPPPSRRVSDRDAPALQRFVQHRLRADVAHQRLRASLESKDERIAQAAVLAIGGLSRKPSGAAAKAAAIEGETIAHALELAERALDELRVDDAEGFLDKLRLSGRLDKDELATSLHLLGATYVVRGRTDASIMFGQAHCIKLDVSAPKLSRPALVALVNRAIESERRSPATCARTIAIDPPAAVRTQNGSETTVVVRVPFGPDPYQAASGGDIELWGSGGAVRTAEKIRAVHDGAPYLEASFADSGDLESYGGSLLVKVRLRDVSGVVLASFGDPDPAAVPIGGGATTSSFEVPWWVWAIAGGVAAAGVATAGIVLLSDRDVRYGIGPVRAEF